MRCNTTNRQKSPLNPQDRGSLTLAPIMIFVYIKHVQPLDWNNYNTTPELLYRCHMERIPSYLAVQASLSIMAVDKEVAPPDRPVQCMCVRVSVCGLILRIREKCKLIAMSHDYHMTLSYQDILQFDISVQ